MNLKADIPSDLKSLSKYCQKQSAWSRSVIDNWLLEYSAERNRFDKEFDKRIKRHKKKLKNFSTELINMLRAQYMYHCIFRNGGKISSYLKQTEVIKLPVEEFRFLDQLSKYHSRYVFSIIIEEPAPDFFVMFDIITGDELLLYSPGTSDILRQIPPVMTWFNLLQFNGKCYQTYGPIFHFQSFSPLDIWYITTYMTMEYTPEEVDNEIQEDPFQFFSLFNFADVPIIFNKEDKVESCVSEIIIEDKTPLKKLEDRFEVEVSGQFTRYTLPEWKNFPHFARLYYNSDEDLLHLIAQTNRGFRNLATVLREYDLPFGNEPNQKLSMTAITFLKKMIDDDFVPDWYGDFFDDDEYDDDEIIDDDSFDNINEFLDEVIPYVNTDQVVPLQKIAKKFGIDMNDARTLIKTIEGSVGKTIRTK